MLGLLVALGLSVTAVALSVQDIVVVTGSAVWSTGQIALASWGLAVLVSTLLIAHVVLHRNRELHKAAVTLSAATLLVVLLACGAWTAGAATLQFGADAWNGAHLEPVAGPEAGPCGLVADERVSLQASSVQLYPLDRAHVGLGRPANVARFSEPARPITMSEYTLRPILARGGDHGGWQMYFTARNNRAIFIPCP